jgi:hypothetical protein
MLLSLFVIGVGIAEPVTTDKWEDLKKDFVYEKEEIKKQEDKKVTQSTAKAPQFDFSFLNFLKSKELMYVFIFLIIMVSLVLLLKNFSLPQKIENKKINYEDGNLEERLLETDVDLYLDKALAEANYQLAIRYMFLRTLKLLAIKNKVTWKKQYTNRDYLMQLYQSNIFDQFRAVTLVYERKWYRNDTSNKAEFDAYKNDCQLITNKL